MNEVIGALTTGQKASWRSLGHCLLGHPVHIVHGCHPLGHPSGRCAIVPKTLGILVVSQRIDYRRDQDYTAQSAIQFRGAIRERQRRSAWIVRPIPSNMAWCAPLEAPIAPMLSLRPFQSSAWALRQRIQWWMSAREAG